MAHSERLGPVSGFALRWLVASLLAFAMYAPALSGEFVSDDFGYIVSNPYVHELSRANLIALLDPWGEPALYTANWAPLHLLSHALEWSFWGPRTTGYHVVNVVLHALTAVLLFALFRRRGLSEGVSTALGLVFLAHPANVEAVAWIFQLKTIASLALATGALLVHPRRPWLAALLFGAALLFKAAALFALPVALAFAWVARDPSDPWRRSAPWLGSWLGIALLYAYPQFFAFEHIGELMTELQPSIPVQLQTGFAILARYFVMATTTWGTSTFHEPRWVASWLDPWWLAGLVLGVAMGARALVVLVRRSEEAAWWIWAAAAYAPVSQVFPFLYPMADRYLYTVLPGLLAAGAFAGRDLAPRLRERFASAPAPAILVVALVAGIGLLGARSHERARVWRSANTVTLDSVRHYPNGIAGSMLRAGRAGRAGDAEGAAEAARRAFELGFGRFALLQESADFAPVRQTPVFQAVIRDMAARWIRHGEQMQRPSQADLRFRARAHLALDQADQAEALLVEALSMEGAFAEEIRQELDRLRASRAGSGSEPSR